MNYKLININTILLVVILIILFYMLYLYKVKDSQILLYAKDAIQDYIEDSKKSMKSYIEQVKEYAKEGKQTITSGISNIWNRYFGEEEKIN